MQRKLQSIIDVIQGVPHRVVQRICPPKITMEEKIPLEEREMDRIRANVLTWAACHQRQDSVPHPDNRSGLFTRLWTEAVDKDTNRTMLIEDLYNAISSKTLELGIKKNTWQYVQLWTSIGYEDIATTVCSDPSSRVAFS
ncbi:hypothetical protein FRC12_005848 [Ceratobasidium sp. 428]|nr:hypothetical protein FRC12_005848 [Ceratobasidium sp. 428]